MDQVDLTFPFLSCLARLKEKLGLRTDEYQDSPQLRNWCLRNANRHYVPEYLLKVWRIGVNANDEI
jgi:hypothetical protein